MMLRLRKKNDMLTLIDRFLNRNLNSSEEIIQDNVAMVKEISKELNSIGYDVTIILDDTDKIGFELIIRKRP